MDECSEPQSAGSPSNVCHEGDSMEQPSKVDTCPQNFKFEVSSTLKEPLLFIEACCGCALLSACVSKLGFDTLPIDFTGTNIGPLCMLLNWI